MASAIDIEWRYRDVQWALSSRVTISHRVHTTARFLADHRDRLADLEPYLIELAEYFDRLVDEEGRAGLDPEVLEELLELVDEAGRSVPVIGEAASHAAALKRIRLRCALAYAYASDMEAMLNVLGAPERYGMLLFENAARMPSEPNNGLEVIRARMADDPRTFPRGVRADVDRVLAWRERASARDGVIAPVIEHEADDPITRMVGSLRTISVELFGPSPRAHDVIVTDAPVVDVTEDAKAQVQDCVAAARQFALKARPHLSNRYFSGLIRFETPDIPHKGRSANLAIVTQLCAELLRVDGARTYLRIAPDVAITGDVAVDGTILPVDDESIAAKTSAVFFSPCRVFVVPRAHREDVETAVRSLNERFPRRRLTVVEVESLDDIFADRRISQTVRVSAIQHVGRMILKRRFALALVLVAALSGLLAWNTMSPIDGNPVLIHFAGRDLVLKNRFGQELKRIEIGEGNVDNALKSIDAHRYTLHDINGDGINELFASGWKGETGGESWIFAYSLTEDDTLWSRLTQWHVSYPAGGHTLNDNFRPYHIIIDDFDRDGELAMIVVSTNRFFPSVVAKLDPSTGEEISHYVHPGHLFRIESADVTGDGVKEIILGGTNNAFNAACALILDPRHIEGHGPATPAYFAESYEQGGEISYMTIAQSKLGKLVDNRGFNLVTRIEIVPSDSSIVLSIIDFNVPDVRAKGIVFLHLDYSLQPRGIGTSTQFDYFVDKYDLGPIDQHFVEEYLAGISYWRDSVWYPAAPGIRAIAQR